MKRRAAKGCLRGPTSEENYDKNFQDYVKYGLQLNIVGEGWKNKVQKWSGKKLRVKKNFI